MNSLLILTLVGSVYACPIHFVPYQVALRSGKRSCAGALIKARWVISAAHCYSKQLYVRLGGQRTRDTEGNEQFISSVKVIIHPDYDIYNNDNDLMLIKLSSPASLSSQVSTISLPNACARSRTRCFISGWDISYGSFYPDILQCLRAPIQNKKKCKASYPGKITKNMACVGFHRGDIDSCQGYSGGPVVCKKQLQGIVSWGYECEKSKPGVYTKLCKYLNWIRKTIVTN